MSINNESVKSIKAIPSESKSITSATPILLESFRYGYDAFPYWFEKYMEDNGIKDTGWSVRVKTENGEVIAHKGDYILQNKKGELSVCKEDIYHQVFEKVLYVKE